MVVPRRFLPLFLSVLLWGSHVVDLVQAERNDTVSLATQTIQVGSVGGPIFGTIDGEGFMDFANVTWDWKAKNGSASPTLKIIGVATVVPGDQVNDDGTVTVTSKEKFLVEELGIGAFGATDGLYYGCCTQAAKDAGACTDQNNEAVFFDLYWNWSQWGSLILDPRRNEERSFHTRHFEILPPDSNLTSGDLAFGSVYQMNFETGGHLALVFGNCATEDINVTAINSESSMFPTSVAAVKISGNIEFVSFVSASTLPIYFALTAAHVILTLWYRRLMSQHADTRIRVEEWIFMALALSSVSITIRTVLYTCEAFGDDPYLVLQLVAASAKSIAHGVSRCVYLLVAMGIGVTSEHATQSAFAYISLWLGLYIPSKLIVDVAIIYESESIFLGLALNLFFTLNLLFMIWIPMSIRTTIALLRASNEPLKLQRYQWIWQIYLLAVCLAVAQIFVILFTPTTMEIIMTQEEQNDAIYLLILGMIAYLWRPNPSQQLYAYAMLGTDGEMPASMDLELTTTQYDDIQDINDRPSPPMDDPPGTGRPID
ncbi:Transmembrane protein 87A [Seminavis robusta]|uniref:Transmembrane protein 87A n=1 Tax=Seminavis robusta TaxID=568900 RepID=A0A9N8HKV9_9STRA|nr:Transmembrane protein 87A [Seminavis robusta]|eukprot:Sro763_g198900.1 Transmembrane protein 87A (542) ;mRNA; r:27148-28773